jgi:hypothetical protein
MICVKDRLRFWYCSCVIGYGTRDRHKLMVQNSPVDATKPYHQFMPVPCTMAGEIPSGFLPLFFSVTHKQRERDCVISSVYFALVPVARFASYRVI